MIGEVERLKEELKKQKAQYEGRIHMLTDDMDKFKEKARRFQKELTSLEIENETQAKQNRIKEEIIKELQHKSTKLNETLTIIKMETDEVKDLGKEELHRVKVQLKETEEELIVLKQKRNSLVKEQMLEPPTRRSTLQLHQSTIFTHCKSNKNLVDSSINPEDMLLAQSCINDHAQTHRIVSANVSVNNLHRPSHSKPIEFKDKQFLDRRFSFTKNMTPQDRELEQKLQQFLSRSKEQGVKTDQSAHHANKSQRKNKTEWFINVINSLDKKLKDIKVSMRKKD